MGLFSVLKEERVKVPSVKGVLKNDKISSVHGKKDRTTTTLSSAIARLR